MIRIAGPSNGYLHVGTADTDRRIDMQKTEFFEFDVRTLGEALAAYCLRTGSTFRLYDGSDPQFLFHDGQRKFIWFDTKSRFGETLADVHVCRNGEDICLKQDLSFALLDGDLVKIGLPAC